MPTETIELVTGLANQFGVIQAILLLMSVAGLGVFLYLARSTHSLVRGQRSNMEKTSTLALQQDANSATAEDRWHERDRRREDERKEFVLRIDTLQAELTQLKIDNAYGRGVIDTITKAREEDNRKAAADKRTMLEKIENLERDVDALKKQNLHSDERIAEQIETIDSLETDVKRLTGLLEAEQRKSEERNKQLQAKVIELSIAERKRKECEDKQAEKDKPEGTKKTIHLDPKPKQDLEVSA